MSSAGLGARATPAGGFPLGGDSLQRGRPGWVGTAAVEDGTGEAVGLELERVVQLLHRRAADGEGAVRALTARGAPAAQLHAADADLRDIVAELDAAQRCLAACVATPPPRPLDRAARARGWPFTPPGDTGRRAAAWGARPGAGALAGRREPSHGGPGALAAAGAGAGAGWATFAELSTAYSVGRRVLTNPPPGRGADALVAPLAGRVSAVRLGGARSAGPESAAPLFVEVQPRQALPPQSTTPAGAPAPSQALRYAVSGPHPWREMCPFCTRGGTRCVQLVPEGGGGGGDGAGVTQATPPGRARAGARHG
jgi:hypothetical protein